MLDVDGVLVDGKPDGSGARFATLQDDLGMCPEVLRDGFFGKVWREVVEGRRPLVPTLTAYLKEQRCAVTAPALIKYWFANDARLVPKVLDGCRSARQAGISVFLATNQEHCRADYLMTKLGLRCQVDGIIYSARIGAQKPDPVFYAEAGRKAGVPAGDILLVDDTRANVVGARRAGWQAVHWMPDTDLKDVLAL